MCKASFKCSSIALTSTFISLIKQTKKKPQNIKSKLKVWLLSPILNKVKKYVKRIIVINFVSTNYKAKILELASKDTLGKNRSSEYPYWSYNTTDRTITLLFCYEQGQNQEYHECGTKTKQKF